MFYVYHIEVGEGQYIGMTKKPYKRNQDHLSCLKRGKHSNDGLQKAFNVSGTLEFYIVGEYTTKEKAEQIERDIIEETDNAFNLVTGTGRFGDGIVPPTLKGVSKETRMKLSIANRGKKPTEETRKKISNALKGRPVPASILAKRKPMTGQDNAFFGRIHSESAKRKMSLAKKGKIGRPCIIDGVEYPNAPIASEVLNIPKNTIDYRNKSKNFTNYVYKD